MNNSNSDNEVIDSDAFDLLQKMLVIDPIRRITARQAIKHPFFKDIHG